MRKELELLLDCPVCDAKYGPSSVQIVSGSGSSILVHIRCENCQTNSLAVLSKNQTGTTAVTMGMLTDLDYEEAAEMLEANPISADEVLDVHQSTDF